MKKTNIKYSIVIPMYNGEKYVARTLDNLLKLKNNKISFEIIVVNDGSTDKSLEIAEEYAQRETTIRVINQKNQGVSVARNKGIEESTGEYIIFIDADDLIEENILAEIEKVLKEKDIVYYGYDFVKDDNVLRIIENNIKNELSGKEALIEILLQKLKVHISSAVYRKEFLIENNIKFLPGMAFGEDNNFIMVSASKAKNVGVINKILFHYLENDGSAVNKPLSIKRIDSIKSMQKTIEIITKYDSSKEILQWLNNKMAMECFNVINNYFIKNREKNEEIEAIIYGSEVRKNLKKYKFFSVNSFIRFVAVKFFIYLPWLYLIMIKSTYKVARKVL